MKRKSLLFLALMALFAPLAMNGQQTNTLLTEGFESSTLNTTYQATAWYSYNAGSGNNWLFGQMGQHTGSNCAYYAYDSSNPANCYMVSMPFSVNANMTQLSVSLYQKVANSSYPETFEVFFVKADDVTTQAAVASATQYSAIASASYTNTDWTERTGYNTNSALAGHWVRVVVHCTSAADMFRLHIDDLTVTETFSDPYPTTISSPSDWDAFCAAVNGGHSYSGETVTLQQNISLTSSNSYAGMNGNNFSGTFNGNGKTITVNYTATGKNCAPFCSVENAAINDLVVTGTINSAYESVGGICGIANGSTTFTNCISNVAITSTCTSAINDTNGRSTCGGFVGSSGGNANPTFVGCAFTGSITAQRNHCGGFIGFHYCQSSWGAANYGGRSTFTNCFFAPSSISITGSNTAVFASGYDESHMIMTVTNSYYNEAGAQMSWKQNAKRAYSVTGASPVTVAMSGTANPTYNVSGISVYSPGITLGSTIYGGENDQLSLTLSGSSSGYQASAGSLSDSGNPYALTMTTSNSVISAIQTQPATLPYTEKFENGQNGWEFGNGTQTNYWMVGSNTSYSSSNSLYITNNGTANAYSNTTSYVYAYRKLNIPSAGDYVVSFKWIANGESDYDLLRAFMIPVSVNPTLTGGTNNGQSSYTNTTPTGWIDVANPSGQLNLQTTWQSSDNIVNLSTAGEYYLVFFWKNDGSGGTTPPAAVDDIDVHARPVYTITTTANPQAGGTVSGGGQFYDGTSVTVTASANSNYCFVNWTENGTEVSRNQIYTFTATDNRTLYANFVSMDANNITVDGINVACGNSATLTASGLTGVNYNWYSDAACTNLVASGSTYTTPTLTDNITYYVKAVKQSETIEQESVFSYTGDAQTYDVPAGAESLKLEVWGAQGGNNTTTGGKGGYSVGMLSNLSGISSLNVYVGQQSTSSSGGWNGGGGMSSFGKGGGGGTDIRLNGNTYYDRIIVAGGGGGAGYSNCYGGYGGGENGGAGANGTANGGGGGTQTSGGSSSSSTYAGLFGSASTSSDHNGGGGGGGWYGGGAGTGGSTDSGAGGGSGYVWTAATASSAPSGYNVPDSYYLADARTIAGNATMPNPDGGEMTGREGNGYARITAYINEACESDAKAVTVTVNQPAAPTNVTASNVSLTTATVSWDANGESSWQYSIDNGANWTNASTNTVNLSGLTPGQTYTFQVKAVGSGTCESMPASVQFTTLSTYNVTVTANPAVGGTVSINNGTPGTNVTEACNANSTVTATANEASGYHFVNWTEGSSVVSSNASYSFSATANRDLVANFALNTYTITATANPAAGGTITGAGTYSHGATATLTATVNSGYTFGGWYENSSLVSTDATYSFTVTEAGEYVANFEANLYNLTVAADPTHAGSVTVNPAGTPVSSSETYTVGTGESQKANAPFGKRYTFVEMLYTKDELTAIGASAGSISSIAFKRVNANDLANQIIDVYMKTTTESSLSTYISIDNADLVCTSYTLTDQVAGWVTIPLTTPFNWDGESNVLVAVNKTSAPQSSDTYWYNTTDINSILFNNSSEIDPTHLNEYSANDLSCRPNIQFTITPASSTYQYAFGTPVELTATANSGYYFYNWTDGSNNTYTDNPLNVTVTEDMAYTAHFVNYKRFVTDGDWNVDNNWSPTGAPTIKENVHIEAAATIPNEVVATANEITINGGSITIADGGQLQHNNSGVTVTTQKSITGYGNGNAQTNKGYYLISSPVDGIAASDVTGLQTSQHYDLYKFVSNNEEGGNLLEWVHVNGNLEAKTGYIYASEETTALGITGTVAPSATNIQKTLTYNEGYRFGGWNLIGNPFVCNAYVNVANYYILNHQSGYDEFVATDNSHAIAPMSGLMVVATATGQSVTYSRTAPSKGSGILNIDVNRTMDRGTATLDRARVRFGEGRNLEKFQFDTRHTKVYIPEGGNDFSVYYADGAGTIPVNFKAQDNGRYTLDFSTEDVGFNYLHLIDNMNGNDVDLLQTPYYAFDAKSTDFASRFTLVFATGSSTGSETGTFAFFNNGVWIINNPSTGSGAEATLQVVDVLGHILSSENISGSTSKAINVAPGVYMLRLINGDKVKVQKIVVR